MSKHCGEVKLPFRRQTRCTTTAIALLLLLIIVIALGTIIKFSTNESKLQSFNIVSDI